MTNWTVTSRIVQFSRHFQAGSDSVATDRAGPLPRQNLMSGDTGIAPDDDVGPWHGGRGATKMEGPVTEGLLPGKTS